MLTHIEPVRFDHSCSTDHGKAQIAKLFEDHVEQQRMPTIAFYPPDKVFFGACSKCEIIMLKLRVVMPKSA
jgi:hypothetical protein